MKFYSCTVSWSWEGLEVYNSYLLQIWVEEDHLDTFLLHIEGTILYQ